MTFDHGVFTVSLDFELLWGVRETRTIESYGENLRGVRRAIPEMLRVFGASGIHATWATVGFLFHRDVAELKASLPDARPRYTRAGISPYEYIDAADTLDPLYHFEPDLIARIARQTGQAIGTHTYSHYYCLEEGQGLREFEADLACAVEVARRAGVYVRSIVFPRNQCNDAYLAALAQFGVLCYRGTQHGHAYAASDKAGQSRWMRATRLLDAYVDVSGHNTHALEDCYRSMPFNFPASSFLRPYRRKSAWLDGLRLKRITDAMTYAAINKRLYHLWWHPHNFGRDTAQNIAFLQRIADHYAMLRDRYGFVSLNMEELCALAARHRTDEPAYVTSEAAS
ncbi:polysaccharide deacetylase family protein [Caballeronia sp. LZ062]|uniref:polysaccharide deacetylase family protein n=1 Tax=unclassified Caballeronia TaxID=2646786 RepID=UPI00285B1F00|nr:MULTISPECIES: polysaccharide deacetylase family protein [unclassified Caballeronia]MDR5856393.1 polysaccharide deacetylase family protein [Caballeronia sp. LZ050]MDR5873063.1 polysaccharide deacetylase family protein [Caballeronia sp. LZ062]